MLETESRVYSYSQHDSKFHRMFFPHITVGPGGGLQERRGNRLERLGPADQARRGKGLGDIRVPGGCKLVKHERS